MVLSHTPECRCVGTKRVEATSIHGEDTAVRRSGVHSEAGGHQTIGRVQPVRGYADADGLETVEAWECTADCAVRLLDEQSGAGQHLKNPNVRYGGNRDFTGCSSYPGSGVVTTRYFDGGGASRFFYCPKATRSERNLGGCDNKHPTVKPLKLMQWLCRLITPPGGIVLDPFAGSGSTLAAALREGFRAIGIEREAQYVTIAQARIAVVEEQQLAAADAAYIDWEALAPLRRATRAQP